MSNISVDQNIYDYIASLKQRVENLETGGRRIVSASDSAQGDITLAAGEWVSFAVTLFWPDVEVNPGGTIYVTVLVDGTNAGDVYPDGANMTDAKRDIDFQVWHDQDSLESDPYTSAAMIYIRNRDSVSHDYTLRAKWTFTSGQTGQQT